MNPVPTHSREYNGVSSLLRIDDPALIGLVHKQMKMSAHFDGAEEANNLTSDLLQRGLFSRYLECPVCASTKRIHWPTPSQSNSYISAGARRIGVSEKIFLDSMDGHKCLFCGAVYFDPWLSLRLQKELYGEIFPQHNLGWESFWAIVKDPHQRPNDVALHDMITEKIPSLKTYAEIGCPFNGLIPYLRLTEYQYRSKKYLDYPGTYDLKTAVELHPRVGGMINFERLGLSLRDFFNGVQLLRVFPLKRLIKRCLIRFKRAHDIPRRRTDCYYIRHDSSFLWGKNCKSLGVDCSTALKNCFGTQILSLEEVKAEKIRFDLVGIFNSLDHYRDPFELLRQIFEFTDYIYLEGHCAQADWGKQHLYFLQEEVFSALPRLLPFAEEVSDFKGRAPQNWYSLLLRKKRMNESRPGLEAGV